MNTYIESLNWRYATKKFDSTKKIAEEDLEKLLKAVQLSASAYGLQPYEIIVVENPELREKLRAAAWDQSQVSEASHLIVLANLTHINANYIDSYLDNIANIRELKREDLQGFEDMLHNTVLKFPAQEQNDWAAKQTYLALGNMLSAAADLRIDVCPMEGFDPQKFDDILNLKEKGLTTAVIAPIGYRSADDKMQHATKVRKSSTDLINRL
ncbi:NAD(P)H-dependent oxidoreductase [Gillisia sp. M10.2A]|uniref:NAD(P)H-dependent oxidoreductase n=1 Tax=Gillisia lutea TaxID=2909668 RepID=A0ABS9EHX9_9FLAO|nr:NAD(P)H-dependent oxidoreductase [Gillisia lutea]MCF4102467.1 NAD(P)H-dependent oxidoreductase [Gillisia lutea]